MPGMLHANGTITPVLVTPHEDRLVVRTTDAISGVPLQKIRRDASGALRRNDQPDWRVVLDEVPPDSWPTRLPALDVSRQGQRGVAIALVVGLALVGGSWLGRDRIIAAAAPLLPHSVTDPIGRAYLAQMGRRCDGGPGNAALTRLTARLLPEAGLPEPVSVTVIDTPEVNAVALPGGHVALYSGLIAQAESPEEVAAALAHEIEHIAYQHPNQSILRDSGPAVIARTLGSDAGQMADLTVLTKGDKAAESEADAGAIILLAAAAISTAGAVEFFERQSKADGGFSDSHPADAERARAYDKGKQWGTSAAMSDSDWQALRAICTG